MNAVNTRTDDVGFVAHTSNRFAQFIAQFS
jgi:hypothetical protein